MILIVADDHAWTDYSFMGHPQIATPHIDRLARKGCASRTDMCRAVFAAPAWRQ